MAEDSRTSTREGSLGEEATQRVSSDLAPLSAASMRAAPAAGTLIGKYIVEGVIGAGGMGIVLSARHEELGELVAVKLLHPKAATDEVSRERFVREARATVRIKSEHVVRVLDAGKDAVTGAPYIVMEHLEGRDLGHILQDHGAMAVPMAVDLMMQICEAVAAAHALGIIHRDLKPSNFFVTERSDHTPLVKVLDFGISKASEQNGEVDPRLTETQAVFGSPTYMSPEQIRSSKNVDPRSDVWSLGVGLFEMLTGKLPFIADNVSGLLASVVADAPFRVTTFAPDVPAELEAIVHGCLEKDPSRRVASCVELAIRLAPFASAEGQQLAARIERIGGPAAGSSSFRPSGPPGSSTHPSLPPLSAASSRHSGPGGVAYGNTGDLSASGSVRRPPRRGAVVAILVALGALTVGAAAIGGFVYASRHPRTSASMTPTASTAPPLALTGVAPALPSAQLPLPATPEEPSSALVAGKRAPRVGVGAGRVPPRASAAASGAAAPVAAPPPAVTGNPANPNLDSRF